MENQIQNETCVVGKAKFTVLVEEDPGVRHVWSEHYSRNDWNLEVFENPLEFLAQLDRFRNRPEKIYFFFDQDFGRIRGVGTQLARAVQGLSQSQVVSLVTAYEPRDFENEMRSHLIDYVFEKFPEIIFGKNKSDLKLGAGTHDSRDEYRCNLERELGFKGENINFTLEAHFPSCAPKPEPTSVTTPIQEQPNETAAQLDSKAGGSKPSWCKRFKTEFSNFFRPVEIPPSSENLDRVIDPWIYEKHWKYSPRYIGIDRN